MSLALSPDPMTSTATMAPSTIAASSAARPKPASSPKKAASHWIVPPNSCRSRRWRTAGSIAVVRLLTVRSSVIEPVVTPRSFALEAFPKPGARASGASLQDYGSIARNLLSGLRVLALHELALLLQPRRGAAGLGEGLLRRLHLLALQLRHDAVEQHLRAQGGLARARARGSRPGPTVQELRVEEHVPGARQPKCAADRVRVVGGVDTDEVTLLDRQGGGEGQLPCPGDRAGARGAAAREESSDRADYPQS